VRLLIFAVKEISANNLFVSISETLRVGYLQHYLHLIPP